MPVFPLLRRTLFPWILSWRRVRVSGLAHLPLKGPYILAPNHVSYLDPPMVGMILACERGVRAFFIGRQDIGKWAARLGLANWLGIIPLNQQDRKQALEQASAKANAGTIIGIYPEGRRNTSSNLLRPRSGVARLALRTGLPVVPVGVRAPEGWTTVQAIRNFFNRSSPIEVQFGAPIVFAKQAAETIDRSAIDRVLDRVMSSIASLSGKSWNSELLHSDPSS